MTQTTTNGLILYDTSGSDGSATFGTWLNDVDGITTSNFKTIDTILTNHQTQITAAASTPHILGVWNSGSSTYLATYSGVMSSYITDSDIVLTLDITNSGAVSLNITPSSGTPLGLKNVMKVNSAGSIVAMSGGELKKNKDYLFRYDGTQWIWITPNSGDQSYIAGASGNLVTVNSDNTLLGTTTPASFVASTAMPYILYASCANFNPVDATTYYFGSSLSLGASETTQGFSRVYIPRTGTVKRIDIAFRNAEPTGTLGSAQTSSIYFRYNATTDTLISNAVLNNSSVVYLHNSAMSINVTAGSFFEIKWVCPTWVTNPTNVSVTAQIFIS